MANEAGASLQQTPLYTSHTAAGARVVPFAGYAMPVQYADGIIKEHKWTRENAGLFDVSHMGIAHLQADDGSHGTVAKALEMLVPADLLKLSPGRQRYTQLTNETGGILDDLIVTRPAAPEQAGVLYLVVNAARKHIDYEHIIAHLPSGVSLLPRPDDALIAIQGPSALDVMTAHDPRAADMVFMSAVPLTVAGSVVQVSRSGYTGEDGFELSVPADKAAEIWEVLLGDARVKPVGLGARDTLRLEAGLCLYGHDIDETTSPVEAGLTWSIQKRRRQEGGFLGEKRILEEIVSGPQRKRAGIQPVGKALAREGTEIQNAAGDAIGHITSGGFGPTANGPVAMGYVDTSYADIGTEILLMIRGKACPAKVVALPFVPHRYKR